MPDTAFPGVLVRGSKGSGVKVVQEWLTLNGFNVAVDSAFGPATEFAVGQFQKKAGLSQTGRVTRETFDALVAPMARATADLAADSKSLGVMVVAYAKQHLKEHPMEAGGENRGPWVRLYMDGREGAQWPWCAGFVSYVLKHACRTLGVAPPIRTSFSCDSLAASAKENGLFVADSQARAPGTVAPGWIFLSRRTPTDWVHTGIVLRSRQDVLETIEGNTNDQGSREGFEVCQRIRGYDKKDFIRI